MLISIQIKNDILIFFLVVVELTVEESVFPLPLDVLDSCHFFLMLKDRVPFSWEGLPAAGLPGVYTLMAENCGDCICL